MIKPVKWMVHNLAFVLWLDILWSTPVASYSGPCFSTCYPIPHNQFFTLYPEINCLWFFSPLLEYNLHLERSTYRNRSMKFHRHISPILPASRSRKDDGQHESNPVMCPPEYLQPLAQGKPPFWLSMAEINFSCFWNLYKRNQVVWCLFKIYFLLLNII